MPANSGRTVHEQTARIVPETDAERVMDAWREHPAAAGPAIIGRVAESRRHRVLLTGSLGGTRILDLLSGEQLPRIC